MLQFGTVPELALFVRLLAEQVYTARLPTGQLRDASDFHAWLIEVSEIAAHSKSLDQFLEQI
jgi:hypothetical protein